ncbi:hypothetical protein O181_081348 [Austropuccinia psidii MF-1]|uniref:SNF2 N-terminal domain-containing protein n=1 Tax=Austropuccinia psidii MF-1 TaxID=1389203 RepID=A0A9Q3FPP5_9BASI|nr:hypothetical protein [Austropuccinia psidii MF-1]
MSTPSQPLFIGMINICIQINHDIALNPDNSHLASLIILWHNQHNIFVYLPNHQNTIGSLPGTLSKMLIPFLGAPQTFMHCGPGGAWISNCQSNPTQTLFVDTPLGGMLADDMGLGKIIQATALTGTTKERLITNPQRSMPTIIICSTGNLKYPRMLRLERCKPKSTIVPLVTHYARPTS